jgi:hypothetical protein
MFNRSLTPFGAAFTPKLTQSIICDGGASMTRTFTSTSGDSWAIALRRSKFGGTQNVLSTSIQFDSSDRLVAFGRTSTRVFRDVGWYVFLFNPTSMYVASSSSGGMDEVTGTGTYAMASIANPVLFGSASHFEGGCAGFWHADSVAWATGDFVNSFSFDGQSITIADDPALSYGPDGVRLLFADTAAFGDDTSGNGNDWTPTGFVAGDQTADVPGRPYAVWSEINRGDTGLAVLDGGLGYTISNAVSGRCFASLAASTGRFYWELRAGADWAASPIHGIAPIDAPTNAGATANNGYGFESASTSRLFFNSSATGNYGSQILSSETLMIAVDFDVGKIWYGKNGTWFGSGDPVTGANPSQTIITGVEYAPMFGRESSAATTENTANFGQRPFTYTPPTGFLPLSTDNLETPLYAGGNWFDANLRTGTGATYSVTTGPANGTDFAWTKGRSGATDHALYDIVRGVQEQLESNTTAAETTEATGLTAFNATGYTAGALAQMNTSAATYVDWMWKAGGAGVANTDGTISSTVSVADAGHFGIAAWSGTGANATVGHGLGAPAEIIIVKGRTGAVGGNQNWHVYHKNANAFPASGALLLSSTAAFTSSSTYWNSTVPSSTVFSIGTDTGVNSNDGTYIAYCFRSVPGLCKVGSTTTNGTTDNALIWLGFKARWGILKRIDSASDWWIYDSARGTINPIDEKLLANSAAAEDTAGEEIDVLADSVKLRATLFTGTWIYMFMADIAGGGDLPWPLAR